MELKKNKPGFAQFVCKIEGKDFKPKVFLDKLPEIADDYTMEDVRNLVGLAERFCAGETLDYGDRRLSDAIFWSSTPYEDQFASMHETGYFHPECRDYLLSLVPAIDSGQEFPGYAESF